MKFETAEYYPYGASGENREIIYSTVYVNKKKLLRLFRQLGWGSLKDWLEDYTLEDGDCLVDEMAVRNIPYKRVETGREYREN